MGEDPPKYQVAITVDMLYIYVVHFTTFFLFVNYLSSNQDTLSQVEDVLNKKKPPPQILDLNGMEISSKEEFKVAFDKIPDYKIRKEKVNED